MVFRSTGIVELGDDPNLSPIERDIVPIEIPNEVPPDGVVLIDSIGVGCPSDPSETSGSTGGLGDFDYSTYEPFPGTVTLTYTGDEITQITTINGYGIKTATFTYDGDDISQVDIDNYGIASRRVTFVMAGDNIAEINIIET